MAIIQLPTTLSQAAAWLAAELAAAPSVAAGLTPPASARPASVLMAMLWHSAEPTMLLTQRSADLPHHAGQISFPGGKQEPGDESAIAAALREAHEEIGLAPQQVQVVGTLPLYLTVSDFLVTPVVALVEPPVTFTPQQREVAEVFEVPLQLALDVNAYRTETITHGERHIEIIVLDYGSYRIWGATARMLYQLAEFICGRGLHSQSD